MSLIETLRSSLNLLKSRERRVLIVVVLIQTFLAFLDLLGVLLLGAVSALSLKAISGDSAQDSVVSVPAIFGLNELDNVHLVIVLASLAGFILVSKTFMSMWLTRKIMKFLASRQASVSESMARRLLSLPLVQIQQSSSQENAYALTTGVYQATLIVLGQSVVVATEAVLLAVLAVGLLIVSPFVTVFAILFFLLIALMLHKLLSGWADRIGKSASSLEILSLSSIQELLQTYREVFVADRRSLYVNKFKELRSEAAIVQTDLQYIALIPKYVFEVALIVGAALLALSQFATKEASAAVATIAIFLAAGSRIVPSMLRLQGASITLRTAAGQAAPTYELNRRLSGITNLNEDWATRDSLNVHKPESFMKGYAALTPSISIENVSVTYPNSDNATLNGISIELAAGQSLALVGSTGAGKSTLADVILGILGPSEGRVLIGGMRPEKALSKWPGSVSYVPQVVMMTNSSVRENVALGLPLDQISDELVWEALERAHLAEFLRENRQGLETQIGESGLRLSGGQRQRLGIARALYTRPRLLVLDEATSALDSETEQAISSTIQSLEGDVTTITIAHRLATIRHVDKVAFLDHGFLIAQGTFEEVRAKAPKFDEQANLLGL